MVALPSALSLSLSLEELVVRGSVSMRSLKLDDPDLLGMFWLDIWDRTEFLPGITSGCSSTQFFLSFGRVLDGDSIVVCERERRLRDMASGESVLAEEVEGSRPSFRCNGAVRGGLIIALCPRNFYRKNLSPFAKNKRNITYNRSGFQKFCGLFRGR